MGQIIEIPNFYAILEFISTGCWVALDIDDTLIVPKQSLGTDPWFFDIMAKRKEQGQSIHDALETTLAEQEAIRQLMDVNLVEEGTDYVISEMQNSGTTVFGLTTHGLSTATRTIHLLQTVGIDLTRTAPGREDIFFLNGSHNIHLPSGQSLSREEGVLFRHGILFTSGSHKGTAFCHLMDHLGQTPKKLIFINDKVEPLIDLEKSVEPLGIVFVGLRYNINDEKIKNYRPEIAQIEWENSTFDHLLSDEEAENILKGKQT